MVKAVVIGVGKVGSCIAFKLASNTVVDELVLLDVVKPLAEGQAMDIAQSITLTSNIAIRVGDYDDLRDAELIVVAAGKPRTPSIKSRLELAKVNARIVLDIARRTSRCGFDGLIVTLTNPVDLMNFLIWKVTGLDRFKILGSSSLLDTARFRLIVARKLGVKPGDVEGYVIGEHGESQVPLFSRLKVHGKPVTFSPEERTRIADELRGKALEVISKKGATVYAPAGCTAVLIDLLLQGKRGLGLASIVLEGEYGVEGVSIGVPFTPRRGGVKEILEWALNGEELNLFKRGVSTLKGVWSKIQVLIESAS